jgi:hypothetical protein
MPELPQDFPVNVEAIYPPESSRVLALCGIFVFPKVLLLFPHLFILNFVNLAAAIVVYVGYWVVLFTGEFPRGMYDFVLGMLRWQTRTSAWLLGLVDRYPPFSLR